MERKRRICCNIVNLPLPVYDWIASGRPTCKRRSDGVAQQAQARWDFGSHAERPGRFLLPNATMFCINVLLTVKNPADVDRVEALLRECGRRSREEPGCLRYDAFHSQSEPALFLLIERWESEAAWQTHKEAAAVQEIYLPQVIPLVDRVPHISTLLE